MDFLGVGGEVRICELSSSERPRERLLRSGPEYLSLRELIAVLLGSGPRNLGCFGVATEILHRIGESPEGNFRDDVFFDGIRSLPPEHFTGTRRLGEAGVARLFAALEIGRRFDTYLVRMKEQAERGGGELVDANNIERLALSLVEDHLKQAPFEWRGFVPLMRTGRAGALCLVERGTRTHVNFEPQKIFAAILLQSPAVIVLLHNHPSGHLKPSRNDKDLTVWVGNVLNSHVARLRPRNMRVRHKGSLSLDGQSPHTNFVLRLPVLSETTGG